ncbi:MAG: hypothetical protein EOP04_32490 [Proteobacteria bacterium]|nr:MAG: hypothetical protein EOP04_32490 [Pseudomonadota bacterium]
MFVNLFRVDKTDKSRSRKFPFLPRVGIVIDFAGKSYSFRHAPLMETLLNLLERGPSRANLQKIVTEQLYEISLPSLIRKKTVNVKARTIHVQTKELKDQSSIDT